MKISEFAQLTGQTTSAIRYYESLGLLKPARAHSGYRHYSTSEIERMTVIQLGQSLGFTLEEMGDMLINKTRKLSASEHEQILHTLNSRKQALQNTQQHIGEQIDLIETLTRDLMSTWEKGECFQWENLPKRLK